MYGKQKSLSIKYKDSNLIFLGSSMQALQQSDQREELGNRFTLDRPQKTFHSPFPLLNIPFWGEAK